MTELSYVSSARHDCHVSHVSRSRFPPFFPSVNSCFQAKAKAKAVKQINSDARMSMSRAGTEQELIPAMESDEDSERIHTGLSNIGRRENQVEI
jgi:hypothetical protein